MKKTNSTETYKKYEEMGIIKINAVRIKACRKYRNGTRFSIRVEITDKDDKLINYWKCSRWSDEIRLAYLEEEAESCFYSSDYNEENYLELDEIINKRDKISNYFDEENYFDYDKFWEKYQDKYINWYKDNAYEEPFFEIMSQCEEDIRNTPVINHDMEEIKKIIAEKEAA